MKITQSRYNETKARGQQQTAALSSISALQTEVFTLRSDWATTRTELFGIVDTKLKQFSCHDSSTPTTTGPSPVSTAPPADAPSASLSCSSTTSTNRPASTGHSGGSSSTSSSLDISPKPSVFASSSPFAFITPTWIDRITGAHRTTSISDIFGSAAIPDESFSKDSPNLYSGLLTTMESVNYYMESYHVETLCSHREQEYRHLLPAEVSAQLCIAANNLLRKLTPRTRSQYRSKAKHHPNQGTMLPSVVCVLNDMVSNNDSGLYMSLFHKPLTRRVSENFSDYVDRFWDSYRRVISPSDWPSQYHQIIVRNLVGGLSPHYPISFRILCERLINTAPSPFNSIFEVANWCMQGTPVDTEVAVRNLNNSSGSNSNKSFDRSSDRSRSDRSSDQSTSSRSMARPSKGKHTAPPRGSNSSRKKGSGYPSKGGSPKRKKSGRFLSPSSTTY